MPQAFRKNALGTGHSARLPPVAPAGRASRATRRRSAELAGLHHAQHPALVVENGDRGYRFLVTWKLHVARCRSLSHC